MEEFLTYLRDTLGLRLNISNWKLPKNTPVFLCNAAEYALCESDGIRFVVAHIRGKLALPELKRIPIQLARYVEMPVVLLNSEIDPRQCRALVDKRIPFVIPNKQVYLPFLAFAATAKATKKDYDGSLSARAQAALVTLIANPAISTAKELGEVSKLLPSDVTRAIDELAQRNLIERSKAGRAVTITWDVSKNALLHTAMPLLSSPVARTFYVKTTGTIAHLPDAGDSALAQRSMLGFPPIAQKAIDRKALKNLEYVEVLEGEVDNADTCEIQVWNYNPLVAGLGAVDDVSLALSLVGEEDERVLDQLNKLFGSDDIWQ